MKHLLLSLFTLSSSLFTLSASAAVPLKWTVETSRLAPAVFDVVRGETIALEAAFNSAGKPFAMDGEPVSIFWQTNGMGNAWWTAPAVTTAPSPSSVSNLVRATFTPEMDPGAATVNGFLGSSGSIYRAAFTFRFRHGPGAVPNTLPLPVPVIDFAKVKVLNPPWSGGGGGGVDTNAVIDIIHKTVDGSARTLPKYLHLYEADDSYPDAAAEYYRSRGNGRTDGGCSSVRDGGFLYRNFDYPFDDRAEFVVKMSAGPHRFASVGVAQVGTNLTEAIVISGKPSRCYKWLPGATVDGINENGVVCEVNVVDGTPPASTGGDIHPLAAVRWALDNGTSAGMVASNLAARISFPAGWTQNFHWMVADERETWIVENGHPVNTYTVIQRVMTNFPTLVPNEDFPGEWEFEPGSVLDEYGKAACPGAERWIKLAFYPFPNITNVWYTNAYRRETTPAWVSDLAEVIAYTNEIFDAWATHPKEYFRGKTNNGIPWWQTVHTSVYDITNRTLRVAVQEVDDWYTFAVPSAGGMKPDAVREIVEPMIGDATNGIPEKIEALQDGKRDKDDLNVYNEQFSPWTWHGDSFVVEILQRNGVQLYYDHSSYAGLWDGDPAYFDDEITGFNFGTSARGGESEEPEDTLIVRNFDWSYTDADGVQHVVYLNATRTKSAGSEVIGHLATESGVAEAIAAHHDDTKLDARTLRWDDRGNLVLGGEDVYPSFYMRTGLIEEVGAITLERPDGVAYLSPVDGHLVWVDLSKLLDIDAKATKTELAGKQDALPYPTNAIPYSAITGAPTSVRTYDSVRHCWWVLEMVNGVPTWTVED